MTNTNTVTIKPVSTERGDRFYDIHINDHYICCFPLKDDALLVKQRIEKALTPVTP